MLSVVGRQDDSLTALGIDPVDFETGSALGRSVSMRRVFREIVRYARSDLNVMIRGESGSGKELVARLLHMCSDRASAPYVAINCAALSESVLESELFGHEKGAFTGAGRCHKGRFERAGDGVLFLDEIGEISASFQAKLLRVLQDGDFERVGGTQRIHTQARVIAATNRDLENAVQHGTFRFDLYFRLNVATIFVPPLRERPEDIQLLAERIIRRHDLGARIRRMTPQALERLVACKWPGNVRELENCILRAAAVAESGVIDVNALYCGRGRCLSQHFWAADTESAPAPPVEPLEPSRGSERPRALSSGVWLTNPKSFTGKVSREQLLDALSRSGWIQTRAGRLLGLTPRQVGYAIRRYGLERPDFCTKGCDPTRPR